MAGKTKNCFLLMPLFLLASCTNDQPGGSTPLGSVYEKKPVVVLRPRHLCFQKANGRDTLKVQLTINGTLVSGRMDNMPYEKDARYGLLSGTISDDHIHARWTYEQEGIKDTLNLDLRLTDSALLQRPVKVNTTTGHEETDATAPYNELIPLISCR